MPAPLVPKRSGVHRIAGIALFRALLSQCRLHGDVGIPLQNIVRNRFRSNRHVASARLLGVAFKAGYDALNILTSSVHKNVMDLSSIQRSLSDLPKHLSQSPAQLPSGPASTPSSRFVGRPALLPERPEDDLNRASAPSKRIVLSRPLPTVSGIRHVPTWTRAHTNIPFLRITKLQPHVLSMAINNRIERRLRWIKTRDQYGSAVMEMAQAEDEWDDILADEFGGEDVHGSWTTEVIRLVDEVTHKLYKESRESKELSKKMFAIVAKERELATIERSRSRKTRRKENARAKRKSTRAAENANRAQRVTCTVVGERAPQKTKQQ